MAKSKLKKATGRLWGFVALEGVLAILFGLLALAWPGATLATFVSLIGIFILVVGVVGLVIGISSLSRCRAWWIELIASILAIAVGILLLNDIAISIKLFIILIGLVLIARGVSDVVLALFSKDKVVNGNQNLYLITGLISLITGIIIVAQPAISSVVLIWIVGLYAIFRGIFTVYLSLKIKALVK